MTIPPPPLIDPADLGDPWPDEVVDLTDRRRILVRSVLGVDLAPTLVGLVFNAGATHERAHSSSSTTMRSGGRSSSTDER